MLPLNNCPSEGTDFLPSIFTHPKTSIETKNESLEDDVPFHKSSCSGSMSIFWRCKLHSIRLVKRNLEFIASFFVLQFESSCNLCCSNKLSTQPLSPKIFLLQKPTSLAQRPDPRLPTVSCCQLTFLSAINSDSHNYVQ